MSQRVMLMEPRGDINPPSANTHPGWTIYLQAACTGFQEIPSSHVPFLFFFPFENIGVLLRISSFSNSFMWNRTSEARNLC